MNSGESDIERDAVVDNALPEIEVEQKPARPRASLSSTPPRLGIAHLLLWVTFCGVYLALVRWIAGQEVPGAVGIAIAFVLSLGTGAAWAGLAVFVRRRVRATPWPIEPGEWLIAILGIRMLLDVLFQFSGERIFVQPQAVSAAAVCFLLALPALRRREAWWWRASFSGLLVTQALPLLILCGETWLHWNGEKSAAAFYAAEVARLCLWPAILLLAAFMDLRRRTPRTWLHWVGISVWLWTMAITAILRRIGG